LKVDEFNFSLVNSACEAIFINFEMGGFPG
jgi:hypothetical protein